MRRPFSRGNSGCHTNISRSIPKVFVAGASQSLTAGMLLPSLDDSFIGIAGNYFVVDIVRELFRTKIFPPK
jgi:hypothetical protein